MGLRKEEGRGSKEGGRKGKGEGERIGGKSAWDDIQ